MGWSPFVLLGEKLPCPFDAAYVLQTSLKRWRESVLRPQTRHMSIGRASKVGSTVEANWGEPKGALLMFLRGTFGFIRNGLMSLAMLLRISEEEAAGPSLLRRERTFSADSGTLPLLPSSLYSHPGILPMRFPGGGVPGLMSPLNNVNPLGAIFSPTYINIYPKRLL